MLPPLPSLGFQPRFFTSGVARFHLGFLYDLVALRRPRQVVTLGFEDEQVHFTFCQAAREQKLTSHCLTIRRPRIGENAEDDVAWQGAIEKAEEFFHDWGTLRERDPLEEGAQHEDGTVDLLLIVDCDSAESLRAELRVWQPKLAPEALVLLHGTLLERESPPRAAWEEYCAGRPNYEFDEGIGLGVASLSAEVSADDSLCAALFGPAERRRDLTQLYQAIAARIEAQDRVSEAERQKSALQLRQAWLDTLLQDRWKAQEVMDQLARDLAHLRGVIDAGKHERAFQDLHRDRIKAQLIMDAQAEQLKQWVGRGEALSAESKKLKTTVAEQKRILNAAKKACNKKGRCFGLSDGKKKERRSIPERVLREFRRIPANLGRLRNPKRVPRSTKRQAPERSRSLCRMDVRARAGCRRTGGATKRSGGAPEFSPRSVFSCRLTTRRPISSKNCSRLLPPRPTAISKSARWTVALRMPPRSSA